MAFVREFLFGSSPLVNEGGRLRVGMFMDERMEGWIGIPHGGIGMGAIVEVASRLGGQRADDRALYPCSLDFRLGGSALRVGDSVSIEAVATDEGASGTILVDRDAPPYLSAALAYRKGDPEKRDTFLSYLPRSLRDLERQDIKLPYYRNCFVCGVDRRYPGLKRKFRLLEGADRKKIVLSTAGFEPEDRQAFYRFQRDGRIHPITLLALLDEAMGWAGFMCSASGGVSVRLSYTFYRPVSVAERLVFIARGEKVKGRGTARILFWSSGGAASVGQDGILEVVATAAGQFLGVSALTEQMRKELIPQEWTKRVFDLADASPR